MNFQMKFLQVVINYVVLKYYHGFYIGPNTDFCMLYLQKYMQKLTFCIRKTSFSCVKSKYYLFLKQYVLNQKSNEYLEVPLQELLIVNALAQKTVLFYATDEH